MYKSVGRSGRFIQRQTNSFLPYYFALFIFFSWLFVATQFPQATMSSVFNAVHGLRSTKIVPTTREKCKCQLFVPPFNPVKCHYWWYFLRRLYSINVDLSYKRNYLCCLDPIPITLVIFSLRTPVSLFSLRGKLSFPIKKLFFIVFVALRVVREMPQALFSFFLQRSLKEGERFFFRSKPRNFFFSDFLFLMNRVKTFWLEKWKGFFLHSDDFRRNRADQFFSE